jgi:NADH:ubiquinone oxidoreductase subunit E
MSSIRFDNAFDAVTENEDEAKHLKISADLMIALRDIVEEKGWESDEAFQFVSNKLEEAIEDTATTRKSLNTTLDKINT